MIFDLEKIFSLIDLTSLNEDDTTETIAAICEKAIYKNQHVAAICVYPQFVKQVAAFCAGTPIKVVTVANFPFAKEKLEDVKFSIAESIANGAQEIDVVFPYHDYLEGKKFKTHEFICDCKEVCGKNITLKVILETGMLKDLQMVTEISRSVLLAGADFLKTSTGKIKQGTTLQAASALLFVIKELSPVLKRSIGLKVSGGVRTIEQAAEYIELANQIMGKNWVNPDHFRIGASQLADVVIEKM